MRRLKKTVVMVGMMGAGKTAVGTAVARLLGVPFLDSDEEIVHAADRSIAEIFERDGEAFFRARETEVLNRLLRGTPVLRAEDDVYTNHIHADDLARACALASTASRGARGASAGIGGWLAKGASACGAAPNQAQANTVAAPSSRVQVLRVEVMFGGSGVSGRSRVRAGDFFYRAGIDRVVVDLQLAAVTVEAIDLVAVTGGDAELGDLHALALHLLAELRLGHPGAAVLPSTVGISECGAG